MPCNCVLDSGNHEAPNASTATSPCKLAEVIVWPSIERSENSTGAEGFFARTSEDPNSSAEKNANSDLRFISNIYAPSPVFKWPGNPLDERRNRSEERRVGKEC